MCLAPRGPGEHDPYIYILRVNHSAKCQLWGASRDVGVRNQDLGGVIARSCKACDAICICGTEIQGCEIKVHQFHVKSEIQTLRTESGVDLKLTQVSICSIFSSMATTGEWRDCSNLTCALLDLAVH